MSLPQDSNAQTIQVENSVQFEDGTGTPQVSPLTVSNSALTLTAPTNAITCTLWATAQDIRLGTGDLDATSGDGYVVLSATTGNTVSIGVNSGTYKVVRDGGTDGTLNMIWGLK